MLPDVTIRSRPPIHLWLGFIGLALSVVFLVRRVEPVYTFFYPFAWWSYIVLADGLVYWRQGNSLLRNRTKELAALTFWSVPLWTVFEFLNLRVQNWYYVMLPWGWEGSLLGVISLATVLPGIFETTELLQCFGLFEKTRIPPLRIENRLLAACVLGGIVCLALPMIWPAFFFWAIWLGFTFLLDPIVWKFGGRSLLRDLASGDPRRLLRLVAAGFVTGGLWELWNFWTRTKWIYTVPGFDQFKLFEMPLLGFLGFPPFAVECYVMYAFLGLFRRNRGWERDAQSTTGAPTWLAAASMLSALVFISQPTAGFSTRTVSSTDDPLSRVATVTPGEAATLSRLGIDRPPDLLLAMDRRGARALADQSGIPEPRLAEIATDCQLVEMKGLGTANFRLLKIAGIETVEDLSSREPEALTTDLATAAANSEHMAPSLAQVRIWVREARRRAATGPN